MKTIAVVSVLVCGSLSICGQNPIYKSPHYSVLSDGVVEGPYSAAVISPTEIQSNYRSPTTPAGGAARWRVQSDISTYPQLKSSYPLVDTLYNLSLDELHGDVRPDLTFRAGAEWDGVWTRDISYSIILSLAAIEPEVAKRSLLAKVKRNRIVQDTGTGGSWPVSTDRSIWAVAAWELYKVSGEREWLQQSFDIIRNSAADDEEVISAQGTGLMHGESTFMDWREQTYPAWMDPVDIYNSQTLGTNAVHYQAYRVLAEMANALGQPSEHYTLVANRIRASMNRWLWQQEAGYYGQYLYGRQHLMLSPRSDALGEALSILFDIATPENQDRILRSVPVMEYGIPCVYPQTADVPPYHNDAIWPFVEAYWGWAGAKRQQQSIVLQSIASIYRASALFLTNKENMVASTGSNAGTQINSDRQLWSVAGNLALVYRILFGMEFNPNGIGFHPMIPAELDGQYVIRNFHYRKANLTLGIHGHGSRIESFRIDGRAAKPFIPGDLIGSHQVDIELRVSDSAPDLRHVVNPAVAPAAPTIRSADGILAWSPVKDAVSYRIYRDAKFISSIPGLTYTLPDKEPAEYQVSSVNPQGTESFLGEPVDANFQTIVVRATESTGESDAGAQSGHTLDPPTGTAEADGIMLDRERNTKFALRAFVPTAGQYGIKFRYANGSGPINTDNKCAIRTLYIDGQRVDAIVMPQRGNHQWSNMGFSSVQSVDLTEGPHVIELRFETADENMNPDINRVVLDSLYLQRDP